jgi:hypothetical protein
MTDLEVMVRDDVTNMAPSALSTTYGCCCVGGAGRAR